jgi:hypothetical protein
MHQTVWNNFLSFLLHRVYYFVLVTNSYQLSIYVSTCYI